MKTAGGKLAEIFLDGSARILCPPDLIPAPGQYLFAHAAGSDSPLAFPLFSSLNLSSDGFRSAPGIPPSWKPGETLYLRGPIGHGFSLPASARKIALTAFDSTPERLVGLIPQALRQNAEIVLFCDATIADLPEAVEVQPVKTLPGNLPWADYAALDADRENLNQLKELLGGSRQVAAQMEAQILIRAPMPCGGIADCGVCALTIRRDMRMICKDGPVFDLADILLKS
jgi:hypothetical protein